MLGTLRHTFRRSMQTMGVDVRRLGPGERHKFTWLAAYDIRTVFDIGSNTGQFARSVQRELPRARLYCFEPIQACYAELVRSMGDKPNISAFNMALGDEEGEVTMHHSAFSPSSSIRSMAALHKEIFPFSADERPEVVTIRRLDDVAATLHLEDNILVKIDVQGYEDQVIRGGHDLLARAGILIVETSFRQLYVGQPLFGAIYDALRPLGFLYGGNFDQQLRNPSDGTVLQADAIFLRNGLAGDGTGRD